MALYAIFAARNPADVDRRIPTVFSTHYRLTSGEWLVSYSASLPADVYQAMKNQGGDIACLVVAANMYYGYHDKAIWDWMESHRGT